MYQQQINHPANLSAEPLPPEIYEAMFDLFEHICHFWDNLDNPQTVSYTHLTLPTNREV